MGGCKSQCNTANVLFTSSPSVKSIPAQTPFLTVGMSQRSSFFVQFDTNFSVKFKALLPAGETKSPAPFNNNLEQLVLVFSTCW